jgi:ribonuclease HII
MKIMKSVKNKERKDFVGIDEVGRGPLAGPVAVCAFVWYGERFPKELKGIKDSKKITEKKREEWYEKILKFENEGRCDFKVVYKSAKYIDKWGISKSIKECLKSALTPLPLNPKKVTVLLDGGLKAPSEYINQETIIKGDTKEFVISAGAIMAKVSRDRLMKNLGTKFPKYGFEIHKGYGTLRHRKAVKDFGMCEEHRRTFIH